jgi:hypothetical protein
MGQYWGAEKSSEQWPFQHCDVFQKTKERWVLGDWLSGSLMGEKMGGEGEDPNSSESSTLPNHSPK